MSWYEQTPASCSPSTSIQILNPVDRVVYFPLRLGYAGTVYKYQGAELDHVTLWLDRPGCPGAAYVALSRAKYDSDYLLGGIVTVKDVVPAR